MQQVGVPYSLVEKETLAQNIFPVVILNAKPKKEEKELLLRYLKNGGALITSTQFLEKLFPVHSKLQAIKYLLPEPESPFNTNGLIDVFSFGKIPANANTLVTNKQRCSTFIGELGGGCVICFPFDLGELVTDTRIQRKYFPAQSPKLPAERVSLVGKNEIRKLAASSLEFLFHQRNLPFVHLWYFPNNERNLFSFRIDSDYGTEKEIFSLYNFLQKENIRATWFLHVQSHQKYLHRFREMRGHEMALHCYEHETFPTFKKNQRNIRLAKKFLDEAGIPFSGFAAPFGDWNTELNKALEQFLFSYSSEFAFDYDNFPSFPSIGNLPSSVLQIPIHPVCIGSLRATRMNETAMNEYFENVLANKLQNHEPLFFYHHPKDAHPEVLRAMFENLRNKKIRNVTFSEFYTWWKKRSDVFSTLCSTEKIEFANGILSLPSAENEISFRVTNKNNQATFVSGTQTNGTSLDQFFWQEQSTPVPLPHDIERARKFSPRLLNQRFRIFLRRKLK
ncbi:MAG: polysaccharide deacetylase family protein [Ignavibacteriales bacterium]|nr:polysaccharide deacetylase family protein [Ignavibacteriales bacterium]